MTQRGALEVILFADKKFVGSMVFTSNTITVGSDARAMLRLDDPAVSPEHAQIHFTGRTAVIEAHAGTSGVSLAGSRVESHLIQPTDELAIGRFSLRFVVHQATQPASPPPPAEPQTPAAPQQPITAPMQIISDAPPPIAAPQKPIAAPPQPIAAPQKPIAAPPQPIAAPQKPIAAPPHPPSAPPSPPRPSLGALEIDHEATPLPAPAPPPFTAPAREHESVSIPDEVEPIDVVQAIATEGLPHFDDHADQYFAADHDDEEDDHDFVPAFSLFDTLRQHEALVETAPKDNDAVAQIVFCRDDFVVAIRHLLSSESYTLPGGTVLEHESAGRLRARLVAGVMAEVRRRGEAEPVDMIDGTGGATTISLDTHTSVSLGLSERDSVLIQFVPSASVPRNSLGPPRPDRQGIAIAIAAVGVHIAVFLVLGLTPAASTAATEINQGRFAMIEMKDPLLDVPKEKPKPKPKKIEKIKEKQKPELKPPPIPPPPTPQLPESLRKFVTRQPRSQVTLNPKASATANKLLSALGPMNAPSATSQAMTNLNAVPSAEGATGGYKVSGAVGRMGDGLHLAPAGSGTGRVETHGGSEFGKAGKVVATTNGNVRAKITKAPPREVEVQGELDRGEIQKVVNSHLGEISGCYERRLVHNSTLAGKITLEWIIAPTGGVSLVKVKFSSVKDPLVSTCMQTAVRLWKFPQPKGGSVTVTYPFVLGATSM